MEVHHIIKVDSCKHKCSVTKYLSEEHLRVQPGSFCLVKTQRPGLRLYPSQPKVLTTLPYLSRRTVQILSHQACVYWRPSLLLSPQPVITTKARKVRGKEV